MSRPIPKLAPPPDQRRWTPPAWDPDAVAADYLLALRQRAEVGPLDPEWVDTLVSYMVTELRSAYSPEKVLDAIVNLQPLLERWVQYAFDQHTSVDPPPSAIAPKTTRDWGAIRDMLARTVSAARSVGRRTVEAFSSMAPRTRQHPPPGAEPVDITTTLSHDRSTD
jgi:hypothetical protein